MPADPHGRAYFRGLALALAPTGGRPAPGADCDGCAQAPLDDVERPWTLTRREDGATVAVLCCEACASRWMDSQPRA